MTILVGAETVLLVLLALFVVALLRSHAEILRRLELLDGTSALPQPADARGGGVRRAVDLQGATPDGGRRHLSLAPGAPSTLLAFLSSGCSTCAALLETVGEAGASLPPGTRLVLVAKDAQVERPRQFATVPASLDVVLSSQAWQDYGVPGSPYFAYVDGATGTVAGEGSASAWHQVGSLIVGALDDHRDVAAAPRIDATLEAAGIGPGHPSLSPSAGGGGE